MPANPTPAEGVVVPDFADYRRSQIASLRPYVEGEALSDRVSISAADREAGSPKAGDMIARNPANHDDQWLVAADYFAANFEPARPAAPTQSAAQTGEVDPEVIERLIEVMCDCQCEGSHMLSESVANEHADDLRAVLSVFRPSLALSQPEPSQ